MAKKESTNISSDFAKYMQQAKQGQSGSTVQPSRNTVTSKGSGMDIQGNTESARLNQMDKTLEELKQKLNLATAQNKDLHSENNRLNEHISAVEGKDNEDAINDVIKGYDENFKKHYKFNVEGRKPIEFDIELKPLSALGVSELQQKVTYFTNAQNRFLDEDYQQLFEAVNIFQVASVKCPEWLKDPDKIFRLDIPRTIYMDYLSWLESFRKSIEH